MGPADWPAIGDIIRMSCFIIQKIGIHCAIKSFKFPDIILCYTIMYSLLNGSFFNEDHIKIDKKQIRKSQY